MHAQMNKVLNEMEELKRFQGSRFDGFSRRRLIENQDTINELTAREFRNCRMKLIVSMIREILKMLNQYAVDYPTFPVNQRYSHLVAILVGCRAATICRQTFWDTYGISGNVFVNPPASSSSPYPQGFNPWSSRTSEHTSPHVMSESQTPDSTLDQRCQSGP